MLFSIRHQGILVLLGLCLIGIVSGKKADPENKPKWAKKDIRDFDDADLERLYDQWEEDDEPLPEDELPEYKKPPKMDGGVPFDKIGKLSPDEIMKMTKKGKTVMMFVNLAGNPQKQETETLTSLWQGALRNNHIQAERYVIEDTRAIFVFNDGAQAWDAKEFLLDQPELLDLTLEGQAHKGRAVKKDKDSGTESKTEL